MLFCEQRHQIANHILTRGELAFGRNCEDDFVDAESTWGVICSLIAFGLPDKANLRHQFVGALFCLPSSAICRRWDRSAAISDSYCFDATLAQIATVARTGFDHFGTGPRSVDAQSKDRHQRVAHVADATGQTPQTPHGGDRCHSLAVLSARWFVRFPACSHIDVLL